MTTDRWLQAASNVTAAIFGIFVGLALADFEGFEIWLNKWQSIIAGFLAIVAAGLTIAVMVLTDDRQAKRHVQTMRLNLRGDRERARRAAAAARNTADNLRNNAPQLIELLSEADSNPDNLSKANAFMPVVAAMLKNYMDNEDITSAGDLYPVELHQLRKNTISWVGLFLGRMEQLKRIEVGQEPWKEFSGLLQLSVDSIVSFEAGTKEFAESYDQEPDRAPHLN